MRFSPEAHLLAVRMVWESQNDYGFRRTALSAIAPKIGGTPVPVKYISSVTPLDSLSTRHWA